MRARSELDAASTVATANDSLTAQQECDGFANHGVQGFEGINVLFLGI